MGVLLNEILVSMDISSFLYPRTWLGIGMGTPTALPLPSRRPRHADAPPSESNPSRQPNLFWRLNMRGRPHMDPPQVIITPTDQVHTSGRFYPAILPGELTRNHVTDTHESGGRLVRRRTGQSMGESTLISPSAALTGARRSSPLVTARHPSTALSPTSRHSKRISLIYHTTSRCFPPGHCR